MRNPLATIAFTITLCAVITAAHAQTAIDLNTWSQYGPSGNGTWTVGGGGDYVTQSINGDPTFFVSPNDFFNTTIQGKFTVQTASDDDYIGFVFGYHAPTTSSGAASDNDYNFTLFDWKKNTQYYGGSTAEEGFNLSRVNGTFTTDSDFSGDNVPLNHYFWSHHDSGPSPSSGGVFDVWDTNYSSTHGWVSYTTYDFSLLYTSDHIKIDIQGGTTGDFATTQTIFDITPADVGLTEFDPGQFGFYNYSQSNVRYESFTLTEPDLATTPDDGGTLDFLVRAGDSDSQTLNVANAGGAGSVLSGSLTSPTAPFTGPSGTASFNLGESENADFTYTFAPTARGSFSDSVDVDSNAGSHTVNFTATALGPVFDSDITPSTTIDLGVANTSETLDTILQIANITPDDNGGDSSLTDLTLDYQITGPDASLFDVDLTSGEIIAKGGTLNITISFLGSAIDGNYNATLVLLTDEGAAFGDTINGQSYSYDLSAAVIPEPTAAALLGVGTASLLTRRRRT